MKRLTVVLLLLVLAGPALLWAQEPGLNDRTIQDQKRRDGQADYPRQGEYGTPTRAPASSVGSGPAAPRIRGDRARPLEPWKQEIAAYSKSHYGEDEWRLRPTCIVLHYTAGTSFPWNLVNSTSFEGERPGLASHYVVQDLEVWQLLPPDVRSRGTYGINHRALNLEMVGADAADLAARSGTLETSARLVATLAARYRIPLTKVYSHQQVARMDRRQVPEVLDLVDGRPYDKIDPGEANMARIKARVAVLLRGDQR